MRLIPHKHMPLQLRIRIRRQLHIAIELEHLLRPVGLQRLIIKPNIPNPRRRILGRLGLRLVDKELLAGRVRAQQRREIMRLDRLVAEELDEIGSRGMDVGEKIIRRGLGSIFAADEDANARTEGTSDGCVLGGELDEVGKADVPFETEFAHLNDDVLEAAVLGPGDLVEENDGAVGAAEVLPCFRQTPGPGSRVVETEADGGAGVVVAAACRPAEHVRQVAGDVVPDAAGVFGTVGFGGFRSCDVGLAGFAAEEDVGDRHAGCSGRSEGRTEVTD